jgi:FlaA1/EpsC-like NDP-sugar epimerase
LSPLIDLLFVSCAFCGAVAFMRWEAIGTLGEQFWLYSLVFWVAPVFTMVALSGTYRRVWSRARPAEFSLFIVTIVLGLMACATLASFLGSTTYQLSLLESLCYFFLVTPLLLSYRVIPRVVHDLMAFYSRKPQSGPSEKTTVLVYGAGHSGMFYLRTFYLQSRERDLKLRSFIDSECEVIGFVDDNDALHGKSIHGYPVLGSIWQLEDVLQRQVLKGKRLQEIVVTVQVEGPALKNLLEVARKYEVTIRRWIPRLDTLYDPIASVRSGAMSRAEPASALYPTEVYPVRAVNTAPAKADEVVNGYERDASLRLVQ